MRLCISRSADVILDSLTPFPTRRYLSGTFLRNILETTSHRYVDLETAILIDSDIDSKAYLFNHLRVHSLNHTFIQTYIHICIHIIISTRILTCILARISTCIHARIRTCTHT